MIRISISRDHPITIIADDERKYYFAKLAGASKNSIRLRLRQTLPRVNRLAVMSVIIETFAQFSDVRLGTVTIEIDCLNISSARDRFLRLQFQDAPSLDIRVTPEETHQ